MFSVLTAVWLYGAVSWIYSLFPMPQLLSLYHPAEEAVTHYLKEQNGALEWWYRKVSDPSWTVKNRDPGRVTPGYLLISGIKEDNELMVKITDNQGKAIHEWDIDWFKLWPAAKHLPDDVRPKSKPGTIIHGILLMPDGDLVFNFEGLGLIRIGYCGEVRWRLPRRTHHSVHLDDDGNLWVPEDSHLKKGMSVDNYPNYDGNYFPKILEVSPEGMIITEIPVYELLADNGFSGLLYQSAKNNFDTTVTGDTLHVNDVETFPDDMEAGFFAPDDVMLSLRNINTIIVFNRQTGKIKFASTGKVLRQHDPDFVDGNRISVLDNNNLSQLDDQEPESGNDHSSRIVMIDARNRKTTVYFKGTDEHPFYTDIMGKQQLLRNGNLLITESRAGRAFELGPDKRIVWEYRNVLSGAMSGIVGLLDEVYRLPASLDEDYFRRMSNSCSG